MSNRKNLNPPKYFMPRWFVWLFAGRLSFGDTFFAGMFGSGLIFVPLGYVIAGFMAVSTPGAMAAMGFWMALFYAVYFSALFPAMLRTGLRVENAGGWRWVGILLCLAAAAAVWMVVFRFSGAG